jgi:hypothetical protein
MRNKWRDFRVNGEPIAYPLWVVRCPSIVVDFDAYTPLISYVW